VQERISDLRSYVSKFELLYDPSAQFPETDVDNCVIVAYFTDEGVATTRSLPIVYSTPLPANYDTPAEWDAAILEWVCTETELEASKVSSVTLDNDPLKSVDTNTLQYLAATVGAVLYKTPTTDPALSLAEQRRVLYGYFPRLKIKGTARSFTTLGQLLTFSDVKMTPLWGRVSPRLPKDVGNVINDRGI
jgi:hypothetical protein